MVDRIEKLGKHFIGFWRTAEKDKAGNYNWYVVYKTEAGNEMETPNFRTILEALDYAIAKLELDHVHKKEDRLSENIEIEGKPLDKEKHYLDNVTYVPSHAKGNASHPDSEQGVIISWTDTDIKVLYCKGRTVQSTAPENLVWG